MSEIKRGDIYYIVSNYQEEGSEQRAGRPAIVVSNDMCNQYSRVVEVVYLTTKPKTDLPTHIDIRSSERPSIALCEQINSVSTDRLGDYIASCSENELNMLDAALLISLGIDIAPQKKENKPEVQKREESPKRTQEVGFDEYIKLQTERNTYEHLYEELLEKVIGGSVPI